jgi:hypothetical protein
MKCVFEAECLHVPSKLRAVRAVRAMLMRMRMQIKFFFRLQNLTSVLSPAPRQKFLNNACQFVHIFLSRALNVGHEWAAGEAAQHASGHVLQVAPNSKHPAVDIPELVLK